MRKGYLMLLFACLFAVPAFGFCKHENYIGDNDVTGWMYSYYSSWTPGSAPSGGLENENFYIGRVRPLKRFTNEATQVIQDGEITRRKNRGLLWWCPINESTWTSLPRYAFDSEAFSMWSYVTIYGNWTQGFLRQPGAFADVCHKNGVQTACVSAAPWAVSLSSTDGGHGQNYQALIDGGYEKLLKLFCYYGIDGLGFNSEQTWGMRNGMKTLIANCQSHKTDNNGYNGLSDRLHFDFYQFNSSLTTSQQSGYNWDDFFPNANGFFLNYNWTNSILATSASAATQLGGSSYDVYAGMDMQGGNAGFHWDYIKSNNVSVGIWGAHNKNMLYEGAVADGSTAKAIQNCYLRRCEQFFTGGTKNPVNDIDVSAGSCSPSSSFHGVAKLVAAKSTLSWTANDYFPFITYLNLGNGKFFNNEGVTTYNDEWYNIGMQDFMPTWRWWITTSYMGRSTSYVPSDTHASFTYEDAWFGGSCLKLTFDNSVSGWRYIQLFKTQFPIADANYTLRVRYKALSGSANMQYTMSKEGDESTIITQAMGTMKAGTGEWQVIEKGVPTNIVGSTMAQLGMRFNKIAAGTEILIGEIALVKNGATYAPVAPTLDSAKTKILKTTHKGVDFKVIWNSVVSESGEGSSTPVYGNTGVNLATSGTATSSLDAYDETSWGGTLYPETNAVDGRESTKFWSSKGPSVGSTFTVDLGSSKKVSEIKLVMGTSDNPAGAVIEISTDNSNWTQVGSSFGGVSTVTVDAAGATARYVRLRHTASTNSWQQLFEFYVFEYGLVDENVSVSADAWKSVYNDDVDTWYFEIWGQQNGAEPQLLTTTTTWAGYVVEMPFNLDGTLELRAGVRAVAPDGVTKSEIVWSDYMDASNITVLNNIVISKPVIKPNEDFYVAFEDPNHAEASWQIANSATGEVVATVANGKLVEFADGLSEVGSYDVTVNGVKTPGLIQISPAETGAMPEIYTLVSDKSEMKGGNLETATVSYTSRDADGSVSKGLRVGDPYAFVARVNDPANASTTEFAKRAPYTYCMWFKITDLIHSTQGINLLYKTDYTCDWPQNNWGEFWCQIRPEGAKKSPSGTCVENELSFNVCGWSVHDNARTGMTNGEALQPGVWYHLAVALNTDKYETMWINGRQVAYSYDSSVFDYGCQSSSNTNSGAFNRMFTRLYVGASGVYKAGFNGIIDEVQCWDKVLTTDEVREAMRGYDKGSAPANLKGYWTFEETVEKTIRDTARVVFPNWGNGTAEAVGYYSTTPAINDNPTATADDLYEKFMGDQPAAGCPIIPGSYDVVTTPTWRCVGGEGTITPNSYNATSGSATVSNALDADPFRVYLKLENSWGASEEKYVDIIVSDWTVGLDKAAAPKNMMVYPNPFVEHVSMLFPQEGEYSFLIMNMEGKCIANQSKVVTAGEVVDLKINGESGLYVLQIRSKNDTLLQSVKIEKK